MPARHVLSQRFQQLSKSDFRQLRQDEAVLGQKR